MQLSINGQAKY